MLGEFMKMKTNHVNRILSFFIIGMFALGSLIPLTLSTDNIQRDGFDKGPSYTSVVPMKKVTFINFDENTLLDDYAYLAAVPTAVFKDQEKDILFSHPLLFYQDRIQSDDEQHKILDSYTGIEFFMEDFMSYSQNMLDQMILVNLEKENLNPIWNAKNISEISSDSPFDISCEIALHEWSYADNAVLAVIEEEYETPDLYHESMISGVIPKGFLTEEISFTMQKPEIGVAGNYEAFDISSPYKYVIAHMDWDNVAIDLDLQLYDNQLGMTDADSKWNVFYGPGETVASYVYNYGKWEVGVTYMPTQSGADKGIMGTLFGASDQNDAFSVMGLLSKNNDPNIEISLYPGKIFEIDDPVPHGCRDVEFTLTWDDPSVALGLLILDPSGTETGSSPIKQDIITGIKRGEMKRTVDLERLGETRDDQRYSLCVFSLDDVENDLNFEIHYRWKQNYTRTRGEMLDSATQGAVLASSLNAPLLFIHKDQVTESVNDVLYRLGVKNLFIVDIGEHVSKNVYDELATIATITKYNEYTDIYDTIKGISKSDTVLISTVDPWTYTYSLDVIPVGEHPGALFIGPAAYIAAHHGTPVVFVDNHPELSQAIVWHTEFWRKTANYPFRPSLPSVACMVLTGRTVIDYLESLGFDLPKNKEDLATMITVADQFDIGATWDRTFSGRVIPGRFCSSPVDIAYWSSRSFFYPALIFENPALQGDISLVNGSVSKVVPLLGKALRPFGTDLYITRESQDEIYQYPLLHTYNIHLIDFNKVASKHWGGLYTTATGIIPYITPSPYSIDNGVTDKVGAYYPDIHSTHVVPWYAAKAGYSNCFSTNFDVTINNLNKGVIMWMNSCHGGNGNYGNLHFWNPDSPYVHEENPWRAYERPLISLGTIKEFSEYAPELFHELGMPPLKVFFKISNILSTPLDILAVDWGSTQSPDSVVMNPQVPIDMLWDAFHVDLNIRKSKGLSLIPLIGRMFRTYGDDGVVINPLPGGENVLTSKNGLDFDDTLENLHSCGVNSLSCLVAYTYLHTTFIRHGAPYQIMDPWSTSWYSTIWLQNLPRDLALGKTIGEAYNDGMAEVGVQYLVDQWWWDLNENVVFFGDPDLRVYVPSTEYSDKNHWTYEKTRPLSFDATLNIEGHMPFGADSYPHARERPLLLFGLPPLIIVLLVLLAALVLSIALIGRWKR